ncbi:hypothetical protein PROPHIGD54-2_145 [Mycobacterium phage prophiGD54-2]|uniref:nuclear transport factor 2 family protein n=1 Tax=Mycobacteroides abscessus TaxID=36809 RepID=UPI0019CF5462|nr:nuclear transport factor 2 family protein [Mycobacteroides abscessus]QSM04723.1 hypothetical protein PROPHIGD54-2_145 [Mycobacterium phage prophiGD54-2]QSN19594.1 nuclear transport factor 2 family protein [Mycobacteroides abscessus subsp. abscessus]
MTLSLQDRQDIIDVVTRYTLAIDLGNWADLNTVFTADAQIDYSTAGGITGAFPDVKEWLPQALSLFTHRQHLIGQVSIEFDGDVAKVMAYYINPMTYEVDGTEGHYQSGGIYHHQMVKTGQGWRSQSLIEQELWRRT